MVLEPSSSLIFKRVVKSQVVTQLGDLWLKIARENEIPLITKNTLLKLANNLDQVTLNQQLKLENFYLLIAPQFNAFLRLEKIITSSKYQVTITFEPAIIVQELTQLGHQENWEQCVIQYIQTDFISQLSCFEPHFPRFIIKAVQLLINEHNQTEPNYTIKPNPPMDKLLHYQVEQERILDRIKIQIGQNLNLPKTIQTAIDHSCDFLELDRLLIYQLDAPLDSESLFQTAATLDTVTYEAKKETVSSTLYFQEEVCWRDASQFQNKYNQGFSLVINDLALGSNLNPCLKSVMEKLEVKAKIVTPINVRGKLWGLMIAHQCLQPRSWQHQEIQFLRQLAEYLAIAIYHNQSYDQLQQQKRLLEQQVQTQAQQIKDALIAAEAASKSKHEFLGSISHELRTPLTCVIGLSSTLLQWSSTRKDISLSPEKQQEYLYLIQQSGKHLLGLINNILEFSDVESGKHLLNVEQISTIDIAKQSVQILQETAKKKRIKLIADINVPLEQEYFFADEVRLKEILFNLLSNSIKFTPEDGRAILRVWREKRHVVFQVEDTGIGIAPEEIPLLFEKFKQIENFRQRTHGGTGLGLALTQKLVELHGGTIEVESALGEGSIFTIYLPVKTYVEPHLDPNLTVVRQITGNSPTIMLVTEDDESATFICQLLNTIDCKVVWLMDLAMAATQIELLQPQLIAVDSNFLSKKISNLTQAIAQSSSQTKIDLIWLGDRFGDEQWQELARLGFDDYLLKSMNPTQMIDKINRLIRQ